MGPNFDVEEGVPYLDNAVTTPIGDEVQGAMLKHLQESYGDPGELYGLGESAKDALDGYREQIAEYVGAQPENLWFTSGGTESNNWILRCIKRTGLPVCSSVEHLSVFNNCHTHIDVDGSGLLRLDELRDVLASGDVSVVSIQHANQDTGVVQDVGAISDICAEFDVPLHVDAAMSFCIEPIDMDSMGIDFLTLSSHKVWGPVGSGALVSSGKYPLNPFMVGGLQEGGMRAGPVNVAGVAGFAKAAEMMRGMRDSWRKVAVCRNKMEGELGGFNGSVIGSSAKRLPNMSAITFNGSDASFLAAEMERMHGMCVGIGSAAEPGSVSRVLSAMGYRRSECEGMIRFRFGPWFGVLESEMVTVSVCSALREERGRKIV